MPLSDDLNDLMTAIATRSATLASSADPKQLIMLAKAAEAMRGTVALQAVIEASNAALTGVSGAQTTALAALAAALTTSQGALDTKEDEIVAALETIKTTYTTDMLALLNSSGNYRIGDMWLALFPDATNLPSNVWLLDGSLKSASLCPNLITAWGLNSGGTPAPFIANYNSTNPYSVTVEVASGNLRLPNLTGGFLRGRSAADVGLYQTDNIGPHTHAGLDGSSFLVKGASGGGSGLTTGANNSPIQEKATTASAGSGETHPVNYAGVWVVRYA